MNLAFNPGQSPPSPGHVPTFPDPKEQRKRDIELSLKDLLKAGRELLSLLTFCAVKPKGTPHETVWQKCPKLFFTYGAGVPGTAAFRSVGGGAIFDLATGLWLESRDVDYLLPPARRRELEAVARQRCESVTGDWSYYVAVEPVGKFRGFVRLADGRVYDARTYNLTGSDDYRQPVEVGISPKSAGLPGTGSSSGGGVRITPVALALLWFAMKG